MLLATFQFKLAAQLEKLTCPNVDVSTKPKRISRIMSRLVGLLLLAFVASNNAYKSNLRSERTVSEHKFDEPWWPL